MRTQTSEFGLVVAPDTLRIERSLPGPIERVWAYLTDPGKRAEWFAGGSIEPRVGGELELVFHHSELSDEPAPDRWADAEGHRATCEILEWEPPRRLAITWDSCTETPSRVTFELSEEGDRVRVVLTHSRLGSRGDMIDVGGGWHAHLGILEDRLAGRKPRGFWSEVLRAEAEYTGRIPE